MKRAFAGLAIVAALSVAPRAALAYRPFDGTDADVAEHGVFELELAPIGFDREGSANRLLAPDLVLNFGIFEGTELVVDIDELVTLGRLPPGMNRTQLVDDDVLLKHVFRRGTLQGESGVSVAAEGGLLLPEIRGQDGYGASLDVITSYRWSWATVQWNEWGRLTRSEHADLFTGVILEGPQEWALRPVAEIFYDKDFGGDATVSALVGGIWAVDEGLSLDAGLRAAREGTTAEIEARLGLTWSIALRSTCDRGP